MEKSIPASLRYGVRKLERRRQKETLAAPNVILEQKASRLANYEVAKSETGKWEGLVMKNRLADRLVFPMLPSQRITIPETNEERRHRGNLFVKDALERAQQGSSDLDAKIFSKLYPGKAGQQFLSKTEAAAIDSGDEGEAYEKQTLQERLADLRVLKVKQGQITAKLRQRAKIRSKNFHRHLKKQKIAQEANDLKALASTDPEAFKEKLAALQKRRIEERMTQRHRQGGRWARQAAAVARSGAAKDSLDAMQDLAQQLLKKGPQEDQAEEMEEGEEDEEGWITVKRSAPSNKGVDEAWNARRRDLPDPVNSRDARISQFSIPQDIHNEEMEEEEEEVEELAMETVRRTEVEDFDEMEEGEEVSRRPPAKATKQKTEVIKTKAKGKKSAPGPVVISLSGQLPSLPPLGCTEEGALDPCATLEAELEELAGEQEDLEADFAAEKAQQEKEEQPEDLDAFLPGWNSWTGPGVNKEKEEKKRKKFLLHATKVERRDAGRRRVVISERRTSKAYRQHQPREVPFPYADAESWEKAMEQPIGRLWMTEGAHRDLVRPRVTTKMGQIIAPLSSGHLVRRDKGQGKKGQGKKEHGKKGQGREPRRRGQGKEKGRKSAKRLQGQRGQTKK